VEDTPQTRQNAALFEKLLGTGGVKWSKKRYDGLIIDKMIGTTPKTH